MGRYFKAKATSVHLKFIYYNVDMKQLNVDYKFCNKQICCSL